VSNTASTISILIGLAVLLGIQAFWIARSLDALGKRVDDLHADVRELRSSIGAIDRRLARIEGRIGAAVEDEGEA
jgi:hypothetical protein